MDIHKITKKYTKYQYIRIKNVAELVKQTEHNNIVIFWTSLKIIIFTLYIAFLQYMNTSVRKLNHKSYELSYVLNGKLYKQIIVPIRGPQQILQISNENQTDITNKILPYMGSRYDWHGQRVTPKFFGYSKLIFELSDGSEHIFENDSEICIKI